MGELVAIAEGSAEEFLTQFRARKPSMLWMRVINDTQTPMAMYAKLKSDQRYSYLLESVKGGENRGRYTIMGIDPDLLWKAVGQKAWMSHDPEAGEAGYQACDLAPREALARLIDESVVDSPCELPLMSTMLVGYLGYDCVRWQENIPDQNSSTMDTPDALMMRPQVVLVADTITDITSVVAICYDYRGDEAQALQRTREKLHRVLETLHGSIPSEVFHSSDCPDLPAEMQSNTPKETFMAMVNKAKDYIVAGDIFQVVLSQRFSMPFSLPAMALFRILRRTNPSPYLFLLECDNFSVTGSSPELLVRLRDNTVTIRPLAGTRRRGETEAEDQSLEAELLADPKEMAEHLMLLDLGRNDVSRVSEVGSVKVTSSFTIERYSHVMHISSNVEGSMQQGLHRLDALMAGFPAGTVSGAPKIRAMEIIDELETTRRGIYAGCVGYFDGTHNMDNCIALRTAVIKDGELTVQAGAGIVADSVPEAEYQECVNKAQAIYTAACLAIEQERNRRQA